MQVKYRTKCCGKIVDRDHEESVGAYHEEVYSCEGCSKDFISEHDCLNHEDICPRHFKKGDKIQILIEIRYGTVNLNATVKAVERDSKDNQRLLRVVFEEHVFYYDSVVNIKKIIPNKPTLGA